MGSEFVFISYSHADEATVEKLVSLFKSNGIRHWYDKKLKLGDKWEKEINEKIKKSDAFIVVLSRTSETRKELIRELELAVDKKKIMNNYPIIVVLVEHVPLRVYPEKVRKCLEETQYIGLWECKGMTNKFAKELFAVLPESLVDHEWRMKNTLPLWNSTETTKRNYMGDLKNENIYIYPYVIPEKARVSYKEMKVDIYKLNPGETAPGAVYPIVMDNQWWPPEYYCELKPMDIKEFTQARKKQEVFRALLHSWQIIVNRAYLVNSDVFYKWYTNSDDDCVTFQNFINNGTIVLYLYREYTPVDKLDFERNKVEAWEQFCLKNKVFCLRMDWDDSEINRKETGYYLQYKFHQFCAMLAENKYLQENIENRLGLENMEAKYLRKVFRKVQKYAINEQRNTENGISREKIYKKFVVKRSTKVVDGVIDSKKAFAKEIKQLVDLQYNKNLADALGITLLVPEDSFLKDDVLKEPMVVEMKKEITSDELIFAMENFLMYDTEDDIIPEYIKIPFNVQLSLKDIETMRNTLGWEEYINAVEASHKRVESGIFTYEDIFTIWKKYNEWLENIRNVQGLQIKWISKRSAISVIYKIGSICVTTVYEKGEPYFKYKVEARGTTKGKAKIIVDFVCKDILENKDTNCMISKIRFFEGVSRGSGDDFVREVMELLQKRGREC